MSIKFHQGKAFTRIKNIYIQEKSKIASFPEITENEITDQFTETFEEILFSPNSGQLAIQPRNTAQGVHFTCGISCAINRHRKEITKSLLKYRGKKAICIVEDFHGVKTIFGGPSEEQFCTVTFSLSQGNSNNYQVSITTQQVEPTTYYVPEVLSN